MGWFGWFIRSSCFICFIWFDWFTWVGRVCWFLEYTVVWIGSSNLIDPFNLVGLVGLVKLFGSFGSFSWFVWFVWFGWLLLFIWFVCLTGWRSFLFDNDVSINNNWRRTTTKEEENVGIVGSGLWYLFFLCYKYYSSGSMRFYIFQVKIFLWEIDNF